MQSGNVTGRMCVRHREKQPLYWAYREIGYFDFTLYQIYVILQIAFCVFLILEHTYAKQDVFPLFGQAA